MNVVIFDSSHKYQVVGYVENVEEFYEKYMKKGRLYSTYKEWIEWHNNAFGIDSEHLISRHSSVLNEITILQNK